MGQKNDSQLKVSWYSYVALIFALMFFSGIFAKSTGWWKVFDFTVLNGSFGKITMAGAKAAFTFRGSGGVGAQDGFLFALSLMPAVIFALGAVAVVEGLGGLNAAQKLMTPLLRPLLGIPGICGLAMIASFQSTDAGAGMTKELYQEKEITDDERTIFCMFQISGDGLITNYFSSGAALFAMFVTPIIVPFLVIIAFKIFGANMIRLYIKFAGKKELASAGGGAENNNGAGGGKNS
jgi:nucleoside recognition membrane protein YjiH